RRPATAADQAHRVDLQHQRGGAPRLRGLRVEDARAAKGKTERLEPRRILGEQVPEIGRGPVGRGQREEHRTGRQALRAIRQAYSTGPAGAPTWPRARPRAFSASPRAAPIRPAATSAVAPRSTMVTTYSVSSIWT